MKKLIVAIISVIVISSCQNKKELNPNFNGHWILKDLKSQIDAKTGLNSINKPFNEFVLLQGDTTFNFITLGKKSKSGPYELFDNNHLVLKNFFGMNHNADVILENDILSISNPVTEEKFEFVKISETEFSESERATFTSYLIPYIHKNYISGTYSTDSLKVKFFDSGKIEGLSKIQNFSFCYQADCRSGQNNSIFLSNDRFEGNYYEYEFKNDSLIIYDIDEYAIARGYAGGRTGIKFALKKN